MSKFKKQIERNVLKPNISNKFSNLTGIVRSYNKYTNKASVEIRSSGDITILNDVPVILSTFGVIGPNLKDGDIVNISCSNDSLFNAKITGIVDDNYSSSKIYDLKKYRNKGEFTYNLEKKEGTILPRLNKRYSNESFHSNIYMYSMSTTYEVADEIFDKMSSFSDNDIGLINPISKSLIKIKDDGCIDVFSNNDSGIRIDPHNNTINFFGDLISNNKKWKVISNNVEIISDKVNIDTNELTVKADNITINGECIDV